MVIGDSEHCSAVNGLAVTASSMDSEMHRNVQLLILVQCVFLLGKTPNSKKIKNKNLADR